MIEVRLTTLGYTRVTREDSQDYTILALPRDGTDVAPLNDSMGKTCRLWSGRRWLNTWSGRSSFIAYAECMWHPLSSWTGWRCRGRLRSGWVLDISRWLCPKMRWLILGVYIYIWLYMVISIYGNLCAYIIYIYIHIKLQHFPTNPLCIPLLNGISTQRGTPDGFFHCSRGVCFC
jgi:hypothetical protein